MQKIAVLITVFNRKEKTLHCLDNLYKASIPKDVSFDVYLTNDGSTDGSEYDIKQQFPQVNILQGNGKLYWNRGMINSWKEAVAKENYDFYLWLNNDSYLFENALIELMDCSTLKEHKCIICSFLCSEFDPNKMTYGGLFNEKYVYPNGEIQEVEMMNGNVVLIPKHVYSKIGTSDPIFPHAIGDFDYGLRAKKENIKTYSTRIFIATCEKNPSLPLWCLPNVSLKNRFKSLYSPLGSSHPSYFFIYEKRHFGLKTALKHYISIHLRMLFPKLWK